MFTLFDFCFVNLNEEIYIDKTKHNYITTTDVRYLFSLKEKYKEEIDDGRLGNLVKKINRGCDNKGLYLYDFIGKKDILSNISSTRKKIIFLPYEVASIYFLVKEKRNIFIINKNFTYQSFYFVDKMKNILWLNNNIGYFFNFTQKTNEFMFSDRIDEKVSNFIENYSKMSKNYLSKKKNIINRYLNSFGNELIIENTILNSLIKDISKLSEKILESEKIVIVSDCLNDKIIKLTNSNRYELLESNNVVEGMANFHFHKNKLIEVFRNVKKFIFHK